MDLSIYLFDLSSKAENCSRKFIKKIYFSWSTGRSILWDVTSLVNARNKLALLPRDMTIPAEQWLVLEKFHTIFRFKQWQIQLFCRQRKLGVLGVPGVFKPYYGTSVVVLE